MKLDQQEQAKSSKSIRWPQQAAIIKPSSSSSLLSRSPSGSSSLWTSSSASNGSTASQSTSYHHLSRPNKPAASNKFHRAAVDGYVDMLCDASKRDTNLAAQDRLQLTPTLLAAQSGQLEALRILVGRGGDPERVSTCGSSALHLAAARNHLNCVSFLVNFGVNMWSLDNDLHTAKDVAAIEQHKQVLDYLDQMMAKQSAINTKSVQKLKEKAKNQAEKRIKSMRKAQLKAIKQVERDERLLAKMSNNRRLLKAAHSISDIKLVGRVSVEPDVAATCQTQQATLTSFINSKLQADLWSKRRKQRPSTTPAKLLLKDLQFNQQRHPSDLLDCSSVSSPTSGYLSSSSGRSILKSAGPPAGPPYSASMSSSSSSSSPALRRPKYSDLVAMEANRRPPPGDDQPVSSANSSVANRLRAIGGVSRKVHLKRLLFSSDNKPNKPATSTDPVRWPEAPAMSGLSRARSEPDFGSAMRNSTCSPQSASEQEDDDDEEQQDSASQTSGQDEQRSEQVAAAPAPPPPPPPLPEQPAANLHQKQLLTQCLSQLKMQHEAINRADHLQQVELQATCGELIKPSQLKQQQQFNGANSDELIQLNQLNAGQSPLRPSVIKQRQQLRATGGDCVGESSPSKAANKSTTILSVDSIGSAGSFAQRNVATLSSSPSTSSGASSCCSSHNQTVATNLEFSAKQVADTDDGMQKFLARHGLAELFCCLASERIDLEALLLLTDDDLKSLNILLGPRRKLLNAIERHHRQLAGSDTNETDRQASKFVGVVDTQF